MSNKELNNSNEQVPSKTFQLPTLPSWKTPRFKVPQDLNFTTPLKRPTGKFRDNKKPISVRRTSVDRLSVTKRRLKPYSDDSHVQQRVCDYDYKPFTNKAVLRESKIANYLQAEKAAHCLVFHEQGHQFHHQEFRPDIDYECNDSDSDSSNSSSTLLLRLPGCTQEATERQLAQNNVAERSSVRRIEEILNQEVNTLKQYWGGSGLVNSFDRSHLHQQYLLLQQEKKEIEKVKQEFLGNHNHGTLLDNL